MSSATILVDVVNDATPELDETFAVRLTSVELLGEAEEMADLPTLGRNTEVQMTIQASDDPFGIISISQSMYDVAEGDAVTISLVRVGGTLGVSAVTYATRDGSAISPADYTRTTGTAVFPQGETVIGIPVPTADDSLPEFTESFIFSLLQVSGGSLGNITAATVLIDASDSPFGVVGFNPDQVSLGVSIPNPTQSPAMVRLVVTRMGGTVGSSDITWNVTGPGNEIPSSDISPSSVRGTLILTNGQR